MLPCRQLHTSSQGFSFDELNCLVAKLSLRLAVPLSPTVNNFLGELVTHSSVHK